MVVEVKGDRHTCSHAYHLFTRIAMTSLAAVTVWVMQGSVHTTPPPPHSFQGTGQLKRATTSFTDQCFGRHAKQILSKRVMQLPSWSVSGQRLQTMTDVDTT